MFGVHTEIAAPGMDVVQATTRFPVDHSDAEIGASAFGELSNCAYGAGVRVVHVSPGPEIDTWTVVVVPSSVHCPPHSVVMMLGCGVCAIVGIGEFAAGKGVAVGLGVGDVATGLLAILAGGP